MNVLYVISSSLIGARKINARPDGNLASYAYRNSELFSEFFLINKELNFISSL